MAVNTNTTVNPIAVARALSALVPDSTVRDKPSSFRGLLYVPVKVGIRSPVTVYEVIRGEFEGDCQVVLAFDSRIEEAKELKAKVAVKDISTAVLVKGIKQWAVYEAKVGGKTVRTVFKIT